MSFPSKVLLDSDTLSFYMKHFPKVVAVAQNYLQQYQYFTFSIITRFEILRGMKASGATTRIKTFNYLCSQNEIIGIDDKIIVRAADIYADFTRLAHYGCRYFDCCNRFGNNLAVATNNESHYNRITGLQILNWNK